MNSVFDNNTAKIGGAVSLEYVLHPVFTNNNFTRNNATTFGGALSILLIGQVINISRDIALYIDNSDNDNKIIYFQYKKTLRPFLINDNNFIDNYAKEQGGALHLDYT
jgi:hypothetical protein